MKFINLVTGAEATTDRELDYPWMRLPDPVEAFSDEEEE